VLESPKNRLTLYPDRVQKTFHAGRGSARRARKERIALRVLAGLQGVPAVLAVSPDGRSIEMSRLRGKPLAECRSVQPATLASLRDLVEEVLRRGIARHSLPPRDVIVHDDGSVGLVDFERSSRRWFSAGPLWLVARAITRFHLLRLVGEYAPELLDERERRRLRWQRFLRDSLQRPFKLKRRLVRFLRRLVA